MDKDSSEDAVTEECVTEGDTLSAIILPTATGAIRISEVELSDFNKSWKRSSYVRHITDTDDISEPENDDKDIDDMGRLLLPTTYCLGSEVALQVFLVCRQIYDEASYIFYGKNRFHVNAMASLIPFLKDRPVAAWKLIQFLSVPVPYESRCRGLHLDREDKRFRYDTNEKFAEVCTHLADSPDYLLNLKRLDICFWDLHNRWHDPPLSLENLKLSRTRMKQLASIASPQIMAASLLDRHPRAHNASYQVAYAGLEPIVFARLPEHIWQKVQHYREWTIKGDEDEVGSLRTIIVPRLNNNYHRIGASIVRIEMECKPFSLIRVVLTTSPVTMKAMMPPTRISKRTVTGAMKTGATTTRVTSRVVPS